MFLTATDGDSGIELWKSDGTANGTVMVRNINASVGSSPQELMYSNGVLFFSATDGVFGRELWRSDGTEAGTLLVKDINPLGNSNSSPEYLTPYLAAVYFRSTDGVNGFELWRTDGTEAGTVLVADINPVGSGDPAEMTVSNAVLYFRANDGSSGHELWKLDGNVGLPDGSTRTAIALYPVPVKEVLFVRSGSAGATPTGWQVHNASGAAVLTGSALLRAGVLQVDVSGLGVVLYLLTVIDGNGRRYPAPFIKE